MTEADTCRKYVVPKLHSAGWSDEQIIEQKYFTDGRIVTTGEKHFRKPGKKADYILRYRPDFTIAVIEAKAAFKKPGDGLQQAMDYAEILGLKFAYSTNGHAAVEHDYTTGKQNILDDFPSPEELWARLEKKIGLTEEKDIRDFLFPFYRGTGAMSPRYYQEIAINRTVEAVVKGKKRILICMATGTGKTFVAFQIIWKLWKTGRIKKVLYLADMNILADQAKDRTFFPFGDALHKIQKRSVKSREIYFGLYQAIGENEQGAAIYKEYSPDYFDLIVVDECHRGSARDDSKWRRILEYFNAAYQIGMTATPKRDDNVDTYGYFGNPIYTYSLKQGIEDGFLAPYRVIRVVPSVDAAGWVPNQGQLDRFGREVPYGMYETKDFERVVSLLLRTEAVAKHLTEYLKKTDRFAKTMVFCVDQEHAEDMRLALNNANNDLTVKYPHYVARVVSDEGKYGRKFLGDFQDPEKKTPVILTTSQMLTTGVDAPTCRNVVLFKPINSMVQFKQIIGRGTRLFPDKDKLWFTIIDYAGATRLFTDPDFDGFPEFMTQEEMDAQGNQTKPPEVIEDNTEPAEEEPEAAGPEEVEPRKLYVDDVPVEIAHEVVYQLDPDGHRLRTWKFTDYTRDKVRELYPSANELRARWTKTEEREHIIEELEKRGISLQQLADVTGQPDADPFDLLMNVAFNAPLRTRRERADYVRNRKKRYFETFSPNAREIIMMLLEKYTDYGVTQLTDPNILQIPPISQKGSPSEIAKLFGGIEKLRKVLSDLQRFLYEPLTIPNLR
ncbi:MAG: DEAD/DEAH box helicase family protein [Candidatus Bathyarchaeia archaeon]